MKIKNIVIILLVVCISIHATGLLAKEMITWAKVDFPPFHILSGENKDKGIGDQIIKLLQEKLKGHEHRETVLPVLRIQVSCKAGKEMLSVVFLKTDFRKQFMHYSIPSIIVPSHGITILKEKSAMVGNTTSVSLDRLLDDLQLDLGIADRSYGIVIDNILLNHIGQRNIVKRAGDDIFTGLFRMMLTDRIDYLIGYPLEAGYTAKKFGVENEIINIPIQENNQFILFYVIGPKTEWGKKTINEINKILKTERPTRKYRSFSENWLDKNSLDRFRDAYATQFLTAE